MATAADGSRTCSTAARARPSPGRVLRALPCGTAHSSLTAAERAARTFPCLHSWNLWLREGPSAARTGPSLSEVTAPVPMVPGRDVRRTRVPAVLKARTQPCPVPPGSPGPPLVQGRGVGWASLLQDAFRSRAGSGLPVPACFTVFTDCQPLKELRVCCSWPVPSHRGQAPSDQNPDCPVSREGWD